MTKEFIMNMKNSKPDTLTRRQTRRVRRLYSHDASQRSQGMLCVFGGLIIAFIEEILSTIGAL